MLYGILSKVNIFLLKSQKRRLNAYHAHKLAHSATTALRADILVGLAAGGDVRAVRDLLGREFTAHGGANVAHSAAKTPALMAAVKCGAVDTVRALLETGALVDGRDELTRETPLHAAAKRGDLRVVKCLLKFGADRYATVDTAPGDAAVGPTAHALARERGELHGNSSEAHLDCAKVLRLEPPTVEGVRVAKADDRSVTIAWPMPPSHRVALASFADELVEAYRVTGVQIGLTGHLATREVVQKRSKCVSAAEAARYEITIHDLPSLQALDITVAARTNGLFGRESQRVLAFTSGRRPRPTGAPRLAGQDTAAELEAAGYLGRRPLVSADRFGERSSLGTASKRARVYFVEGARAADPRRSDVDSPVSCPGGSRASPRTRSPSSSRPSR